MPTQAEIVGIIIGAADRHGVPPKLAVACAVAESGLDERAERWGDRSKQAKDAIARDDLQALAGVMQKLDARGLRADISFGLGQQSWMFAPQSSGSFTVANLLNLRRIYFDSDLAAEQMCALLQGKFHPQEADAMFKALNRYNFPAGNGTPASPGVAANYRNGLAEADGLLAGHVPGDGGTPGGEPLSGETFRVVNTDGVGLRLRADDSLAAPTIKLLSEGAVVVGATLHGEGRDWRRVRDSAGAVGFAADEFLAPAGRQYRVVNTDGVGLRLRDGPGTSTPIVKTLAEGAILDGVTSHAEGRDWRRVRDAASDVGFAAEEFLAPA